MLNQRFFTKPMGVEIFPKEVTASSSSDINGGTFIQPEGPMTVVLKGTGTWTATPAYNQRCRLDFNDVSGADDSFSFVYMLLNG